MEKVRKNERSKFESKKGITLVALVIMVIILLILAGISIATLTGSGLFEKAKLAEQESKNKQELEDATLSDYENKIGEYVTGNRETVTLTKEEYQLFKNQTAYSTDEKVVGTWVDGKPIYRKVIFNDTLKSINATTWTNYYDASNLNIENFLGGKFGRKGEDGTLKDWMNDVSFYYEGEATKYMQIMRVPALSFRYYSCAIIEYTKTTDTAK